MKNVYLFYLIVSFRSQDIYIFVLNFCDLEQRFDQKNKVVFKIYDVTTWETNKCNTHITLYCLISQT